MTGGSTYRREAQQALLDLFAATTGMPVVLYEFHDSRAVIFRSRTSLADLEPYCYLIRSSPAGAERCEADECDRARSALGSGCEELALCHAGLYNQIIPISLDKETVSVMLFGKMLIEGDEYRRASLEKHKQAVAELGLDASQAAEHRRLLLSAKRYALQKLEVVKTVLPRIQRWFHTVEYRVERHVEDVGHELVINLQAVIAYAENLSREATTVRPERVQEMARDVLQSALALDTVVQNLGDYLEEYTFIRQPIAPLLNKARQVYKSEAARRGIGIHVNLQRVDGRPPELEISSPHLQRALNNLVHNAIKYSFRGEPGRYRYVRITGRPTEEYYSLAFENFGVGILPEEIETGAIFQNGYQGTLARDEYRTGAGKGLYFAKQIIDEHKGRIQVESRLMADASSPEGQPHLTQFTIYLPYEQPREG